MVVPAIDRQAVLGTDNCDAVKLLSFQPKYFKKCKGKSQIRFANAKNKVFMLAGEPGKTLVDAIAHQIHERASEWRAMPRLPRSPSHVGTDLLRGVITSIRREIEALGGEVHFNTALTGFERRDGRLVGIRTTGGAFPCEALVFAVGHSARDTFGMLMESGLVLE